MKSALVLVVLIASACARADCLGNDLNSDGGVDAHDASVRAQAWRGDPNTPPDLSGNEYVGRTEPAALATLEGRTACPVVINEILAHAHAAAPDWIELYNTGSTPVNIGGWMLSDRADDLDKFRIATGTILKPSGYIVFYENTDFGNAQNPDTRKPFALTENGETLYLFSGKDRVFPDYLAEAPFGPSETFYSFGRYTTSIGICRYVTMSKLTPGGKNAYPRVGPVIINEVMYHPAGDDDAEYVELFNVSNEPVVLFDFSEKKPWRFTDYAGIDLRFAADNPVVLDQGEYLLLVRTASAVRRQYTVPAGVKMVPWTSGRLDNAGDHLYLLKPGDVDADGTRYWIEVDSLDYSDGRHPKSFPQKVDPWPTAADGAGASLERLLPRKYGNDPNNWQAAPPTPGWTND
jgi:hypothetical protein